MNAGDQQALEAAFQAALAARRETFLARLPRKLKIAVLLLLIGAATAPFWNGGADVPAPAHETGAPSSREEVGQTAEEGAASVETKRIASPRRGPETEAEKAAVARNDSPALAVEMPAAPDKDLAEETEGGVLPKIGANGRKPWIVYARPFDKMDPRPRIGLVVTDLGLSRVATDAALRRLPPAVTLAFDAQGEALDAWLKRARQDGHETLLSLPMEPLDFPRSDPGPNALLTTLPNVDNLERFHALLKRGVGYVGFTTVTGSRFVSDSDKLSPVLEDARDRGLLVLDAPIAEHGVAFDLARKIGVPVAAASRAIDKDPAPAAIDAALAQLEQTALMEGSALAVASPLPVTLERIEVWAKDLAARGIVLAPVSALVE